MLAPRADAFAAAEAEWAAAAACGGGDGIRVAVDSAPVGAALSALFGELRSLRARCEGLEQLAAQQDARLLGEAELRESALREARGMAPRSAADAAAVAADELRRLAEELREDFTRSFDAQQLQHHAGRLSKLQSEVGELRGAAEAGALRAEHHHRRIREADELLQQLRAAVAAHERRDAERAAEGAALSQAVSELIRRIEVLEDASGEYSVGAELAAQCAERLDDLFATLGLDRRAAAWAAGQATPERVRVVHQLPAFRDLVAAAAQSAVAPTEEGQPPSVHSPQPRPSGCGASPCPAPVSPPPAVSPPRAEADSEPPPAQPAARPGQRRTSIWESSAVRSVSHDSGAEGLAAPPSGLGGERRRGQQRGPVRLGIDRREVSPTRCAGAAPAAPQRPPAVSWSPSVASPQRRQQQQQQEHEHEERPKGQPRQRQIWQHESSLGRAADVTSMISAPRQSPPPPPPMQPTCTPPGFMAVPPGPQCGGRGADSSQGIPSPPADGPGSGGAPAPPPRSGESGERRPAAPPLLGGASAAARRPSTASVGCDARRPSTASAAGDARRPSTASAACGGDTRRLSARSGALVAHPAHCGGGAVVPHAAHGGGAVVPHPAHGGGARAPHAAHGGGAVVQHPAHGGGALVQHSGHGGSAAQRADHRVARTAEPPPPRAPAWTPPAAALGAPQQYQGIGPPQQPPAIADSGAQGAEVALYV
eukprot:TRINITY_DN10249_c1_g1_i3.p1 TRINITY_DN10249_c1_g1~~TRINITY_DN10249_c1_g1_i3.p1  ORF type:complete len:731 (+),score=210.85 TRINITY_DN10249_c1_g1_i3:66-2195(+)